MNWELNKISLCQKQLGMLWIGENVILIVAVRFFWDTVYTLPHYTTHGNTISSTLVTTCRWVMFLGATFRSFRGSLCGSVHQNCPTYLKLITSKLVSRWTMATQTAWSGWHDPLFKFENPFYLWNGKSLTLQIWYIGEFKQVLANER